MNAHFRAVVSAQNRTVMYQRHAQTKPGSRNGSCDSGNTATNHHQIKLTCIRWLFGNSKLFFPEFLQRFQVIWRRRSSFGEINGIHPPVEAGQVAKPHFCFFARDIYFPGALPEPFRTGSAQHSTGCLPVNQQLKLPRPFSVIPG